MFCAKNAPACRKTAHSARCAKHPALFPFAAQIFPAEDILRVAQK